jgi:uncharacterized protein
MQYTISMGLKSYLLIFIAFLYLTVVLLMYFTQRSFLYFPNEDNYLTNETIKFNNEVVSINSTNEIALKSWFYNNNPGEKFILFLHGNAGTLKSRIYKLNAFSDLGLNFLAITWRGFSGNHGLPSEKGLYDDAISAVKWLNSNGIKSEDIIIYGESLGTAIAIEISQGSNYAGVILESPFTSIISMGKLKFPYLPIELILKDKFESINKTLNINIPSLVLHGKDDTLVPFYMGQEIFDSLKYKSRSYFVSDDHMMRFDDQMIEAIRKFLKSLD